jgi:hypothetical protein
MSNPVEPSDNSKPVLKDKNPHNYRKVGYSMIVISVSLVLIGLLVWAIGDNYHFSGDIMAKQEIDSMTPKSGYAIVLFDYTQPIGAKLKLLDTTSTLQAANNLKVQYIPQYMDQKAQVLIFDTSIANNTNSISLAEIYAMTPNAGYNIVSFNTVMPVGARLAGQKLDASLGEAINDTGKYADANTDKLTQIVTFTSSYDDNLKQILGPKYDPMLVSENINQIKLLPQKLILPKPQPVPVAKVILPVANATLHTVVQNTTKVSVSATVVVSTNATKTQTLVNKTSSNETKSTMPATNMTITANVAVSHASNGTASNHTKTVLLSEKLGVNSTAK